MSIRTADIHRAIAFYQTLQFNVIERFTTGYTLACWLEGPAGRLELIQIPQPTPIADLFGDEHYIGYYHLSLDLTDELQEGCTLADWLADWRLQLARQSLILKVLLYPTVQIIGSQIYQVAFVADADGLPLELLHHLGPVTAATESR
ncbi:MAG: VOC family protein [Acaryochloridaceae cyanobacterium SU_2_1]|nr:VOC family protein [Acaryochloridaceae cyanobacterium SU_2_1]